METLFEMDAIAQSDWLETIGILQLKDLGNNTPIVIIKVDSGTEKFWVEEFKRYPEVKWAELNGIIKIVHTAK